MKRTLLFGICLLLSFSLRAQEARLELGVVENTFNKAQIPGDDGTRFNLRKGLDNSEIYYRLQYAHRFNENHGLRLLYAPLKLTGETRFSKDIDFDGSTFNAGEKTDSLFQFNSYRATYFYQLKDEEKFKLRLGLTVKVRDAEISLEQGNVKESRDDLGLVPLFYLYGEYHLTDKILAALDFDGLIGPGGRAFDVALMGGYKFHSDWQLQLGTRMLEGGADNDKVYTFSQFNYYFTALQYTF